MSDNSFYGSLLSNFFPNDLGESTPLEMCSENPLDPMDDILDIKSQILFS